MFRKVLMLTWVSILFISGQILIAQVPRDALIAYYPFHGNVNDGSGNGHHGTAYGPTLTQDRFGNVDSAYSFDGVDDYIAIENHPDFNNSDFSLAL